MENIIIETVIKYAEIDLIYIFGSYLTENYNIESDIDIAVLSSDKMEKETLMKIKLELMEKTGREIDLIDLWESGNSVNKEIIFKGKNIYKKSEKIKYEFEYRKAAIANQYSEDVGIYINRIKERGRVL